MKKHKIYISLMILVLSFNVVAKTKLDTYSSIKLKSINNFIDMMVSKHSFDRDQLNHLFTKIKLPIYKPIKKSKKKKKTKPMTWNKYRSLFITETRINNGVKFWDKYQKHLNKAEQIYGIPPEIIVAILGIETNYGRKKGNFQVIWTLTNRAFNGFRRAKFYKKELEHFLLLVQKNNINPFKPKGSYAGAMGFPQFISSSIHHYAVDFDKNGTVDLLDNPIDSIGSITNYLHKHRWDKGGIYAYQIEHNDKHSKLTSYGTIKPKYKANQLRKMGINIGFAIPQNKKSSLIALPKLEKDEYWLIFWNFYVLTRYNHSNKYAMAVVQLSKKIKQKWGN